MENHRIFIVTLDQQYCKEIVTYHIFYFYIYYWNKTTTWIVTAGKKYFYLNYVYLFHAIIISLPLLLHAIRHNLNSYKPWHEVKIFFQIKYVKYWHGKSLWWAKWENYWDNDDTKYVRMIKTYYQNVRNNVISSKNGRERDISLLDFGTYQGSKDIFWMWFNGRLRV